MKPFICSSLIVLTLSIGPIASAEENADKATQYVSDELVILLRAGPSGKHKILRSLKSGDRVTVLGSEGEYAQVRHGDLEGWALSRHLSNSPTAKQILKNKESKLQTLKEKYDELQNQAKQLESENQQLKQQLGTLTDEKTKIGEELNTLREVAAKPLELSNVNKNLTMQAVSLENKVELMKQEIQVLRNDSDKQWFLTGSGVILLGVLIGMIIPKFRRHRRSDWSSL